MHTRSTLTLFAVAWLFACISQPAAAQTTPREINNPTAILTTDFGEITIELNPKSAPKTVSNFLAYAKGYFYDGLVFHRVVDNFVIQTGGYWFDLRPKKATRDPVVNESGNGLKNLRGTIAMARHSAPDSARAQFYINLSDNPHLDAGPDHPGYTVFGKVIAGMDVADQIGKVAVRQVNKSLTHVPQTPIQIQSLSVKE